MSRDEHGSALVEVTWLALLLLVPLVYIVLAVFEVQRGAFGASAAARSAARAYSLAPTEADGLERARAAAVLAMQDQDLDLDDVALDVRCRPEPGNCLAPGATIEVQVRYQVPLPLVPTALGGDTPSIRVEAVQSVAYGTFREDR